MGDGGSGLPLVRVSVAKEDYGSTKSTYLLNIANIKFPKQSISQFGIIVLPLLLFLFWFMVWLVLAVMVVRHRRGRNRCRGCLPVGKQGTNSKQYCNYYTYIYSNVDTAAPGGYKMLQPPVVSSIAAD